ncbi:hypothetical protein HC030_24545 [Planosporangium mesophilum]|nr:hypothetical protein [Planosporangium mesophilum]
MHAFHPFDYTGPGIKERQTAADETTAKVEAYVRGAPGELDVSVAIQALVDLRERSAERKALHPLLAPASIAVVGAGRKPGGVGHEVLCNLLEHGFTGPTYPVNPRATEIAGVPAYPSLAAIPQPVDLAIIAVPAAAVEAVLAEAGQARVGAAVVVSSGFAETGPDGRAAQATLVRTGSPVSSR